MTKAEREAYEREVDERIANMWELVRKGYEELARKQAEREATS
jgi:hypothetical protein